MYNPLELRTMSQDFYNILGIDRNSTPEKIKKAYFGLVREFPPDQHPEKFKTVRKAYEILSDPIAKKEYDVESKHGDKLKDLLEKAEDEMESERWEAAIKHYNTILNMNPNSLNALNNKGLCSFYLQKWNDAIEIFKILVEKAKNSPTYWKNYGMAYLSKALNKKDSIKKKQKNIDKAREIFLKVLEFEPFNTDITILISRSYEYQKDYNKAIDFLFKILKTEGNLYFPDLDVYAQLIHLYIINEENKKLEITLKNIKKLLKDKNLKDYLIFQLLNKVEMYEDKKINFKYSKAALKINPRHKIAKTMIGLLEEKEEIKEALDELYDDKEIIEPLRKLCKLIVEETIYDSDIEEDYMDRVFKKLRKAQLSQVKSSIDKIAREYRIIYAIEPELFNEILFDLEL